ncbi:MAG: hypothetical protein F4X34_01340, partial [Chloroflexi bacterium]|nr:hypothetical protein [Chloroflexota bacterium]
FSGRPATWLIDRRLAVKVTATDRNNGAASDTFNIRVVASEVVSADVFRHEQEAGDHKLVLTFNNDLAPAANLANSAFAVKTGVIEEAVSLHDTTGPVISGATVTLTLAEPMAFNAIDPKVSYTKPSAGADNKLAFTDGSEANSFTDRFVSPSFIMYEGAETNLCIWNNEPAMADITIAVSLMTQTSVLRPVTFSTVILAGQKSGCSTLNVERDTGGTEFNGRFTDPAGFSSRTGFVILDDPAPTMENMISDQRVSPGEAFSFTVPANTFDDVGPGSLRYTATLEDGSALPYGLSFNANTRAFSGTPPGREEDRTVAVKVTATDQNDGAASDTFSITLEGLGPLPVTPVADLDVSALGQARPVVVEYWSSQCGHPCRGVKDALSPPRVKYRDRVDFMKVDVGPLTPETPHRVPSFVLYRNGAYVDSVPGAHAGIHGYEPTKTQELLERMIDRHLSQPRRPMITLSSVFGHILVDGGVLAFTVHRTGVTDRDVAVPIRFRGYAPPQSAAERARCGGMPENSLCVVVPAYSVSGTAVSLDLDDGGYQYTGWIQASVVTGREAYTTGLDRSITVLVRGGTGEKPGRLLNMVVNGTRVSWDVPETAGSHDIAFYEVEYAQVASLSDIPEEADWKLDHFHFQDRCQRYGDRDCQADVSAAMPGASHVRVRAVSAAGGGPWCSTEPNGCPEPALAPPPEPEPAIVNIIGTDDDVTEGGRIDFRLQRSGNEEEALTVRLTVTETGDMLPDALPTEVRFRPGHIEETLSIRLEDDIVDEPDSTITVTITESPGYLLGVASSATVVATDDDDVPGMPGGLTATANNERVEVSWTAPTSVGTSAITRYEVRHIASDAADKSDAGWTVAESPGSPHLVTGLSNGQSYDFQVRAISAVGAGEWATAVTATPDSSLTTALGNIILLSLEADDGYGSKALPYSPCRSEQQCGRNWTPRDIVAEIRGGKTYSLTVIPDGMLSNPLRVSMRSKATASGDAIPVPLPSHRWEIGEHEAERNFVFGIVWQTEEKAGTTHKMNLWPVELLPDGTERALPKSTVWLRVISP